jgi:hypothetical protein
VHDEALHSVESSKGVCEHGSELGLMRRPGRWKLTGTAPRTPKLLRAALALSGNGRRLSPFVVHQRPLQLLHLSLCCSSAAYLPRDLF